MLSRGFALDPSCVLWLPFYKYGNEQSKIWDMSVQPLGPNLVSNGGMETGNPPTGWTSYASPETFESSGVQKHTGAASCHINDSVASGGGFTKDISLVIGKRYRVSFWYYLASGTLMSRLYPDSPNVYTITGSWQYAEYFSNATAVTQAIYFINNSVVVAGEFYIDDVQIQEVNYNGGVNHGTITGATPRPYPLLSGVELVSNGGFETDPTVEFDVSNCTIASIAGGQSGNCLEITRVGEAAQWVSGKSNLSLVSGKKYKLCGWIKSGTSGNEESILYVATDAGNLGVMVKTTSASWEYEEIFFDYNGEANPKLRCQKQSATAGTMLFDSVSVREVTGYEQIGSYFDGVDDTVTILDNPNLSFTDNIFTILFWVRPLHPLKCDVIGKSKAPNAEWNISGDLLGNIRFNAWKSDFSLDVYTSLTSPIVIDRWTCYAYQADGSNAYVYKNGVVDAGPGAKQVSNLSDTDSICYVGGGYGSSFGNQNIGEILVFNRALSAVEIRNYYEATRRIYGA